jgi:uncharacterized protein YpuA (DUF1002 family)
MLKTITITALLLAATPAMAQYYDDASPARREMERAERLGQQQMQQMQQQMQQQQQLEALQNLRAMQQQQRTCTSSCVGGVCRTVCN